MPLRDVRCTNMCTSQDMFADIAGPPYQASDISHRNEWTIAAERLHISQQSAPRCKKPGLRIPSIGNEALLASLLCITRCACYANLNMTSGRFSHALQWIKPSTVQRNASCDSLHCALGPIWSPRRAPALCFHQTPCTDTPGAGWYLRRTCVCLRKI